METTEVVCRLAYGFSWPMRHRDGVRPDVRAAQELEQDHVLLERLEHRPMLSGKSVPTRARLDVPARTTRSSTLLHERVVKRAHHGAHEVAVRGLELLGAATAGRPRRRRGAAHRLRVDLAAHPRQQPLGGR